MVISKSLICALAMGVIPEVFASPINLENGLQTRDGPNPIYVPWVNWGNLYVNITVGSQKSIVSAAWDTGSFVSWVLGTNVTCSNGNNCKNVGAFDANTSTTFVDLHEPFGIAYLGSSGNTGGMGRDQVGIGGSNGETVVMPDLEFGVADHASIHSILGMGLRNEIDPNYLPNKLKSEGHITKAAFSYWWDSPSAGTGGFLLGGLDSAKYEGSLVAVPRMKSEDDTQIFIASIVADGESFTQGYPAIIDTGAPVVYIPKAAVENITTTLGGKVDSWDGAHYFVPCDQGDKKIDFVFGQHGENAVVHVPAKEFLGSPWGPAGGLCPIQVVVSDNYLIGHPVQKYAYWVFDQDADAISVGQPTYSSQSAYKNL